MMKLGDAFKLTSKVKTAAPKMLPVNKKKVGKLLLATKSKKGLPTLASLKLGTK